jgi:hypothetical protein
MPMATINVPLYLPVKKVASTLIIDLQCVKPRKHQNTRFNTE